MSGLSRQSSMHDSPITMTPPDRRVYDGATDLSASVVEWFFRHPELCRWCLGKIRRLYPDFSKAEAEAYRGSNWNAFERSGHKTDFDNDDGLLVNVHGDRDPSAYYETPPPTYFVHQDEGGRDVEIERRPSRATLICPDCCEVDIDPEKARPMATLRTCLDNILEYIDKSDEDWTDDVDVDPEQAVDTLHLLIDTGQAWNQDKRTLALCLDAGRGLR